MPEAPNINCLVVLDALHNLRSELHALHVEALYDLPHLLFKANGKVKASNFYFYRFARRQLLSCLGVPLLYEDIFQADVSMYYPLCLEFLKHFCDLVRPNDNLVNLDSFILFDVGDVSAQSLLGNFRDYITIALSIREVVDKINSLSPLASLLKRLQLGLCLQLCLDRRIVADQLHEEALFCEAVRHDHLVVHDWVRVVADYLILFFSACKPLTLANQKVDAGLQMLVAQEVYPSVAMLR